MKKQQIYLLIGAVCILVVLTLGIFVFERSVDHAMNRAAIEHSQILSTQEVEGGKVVFYVPQNSLNKVHVGYLKKTFAGYDWVAGTDIGSFDGDEPITYGFSNIGKSDEKGNPKSLPIMSGMVLGEDIDEITLEFKNEHYEKADLIESDKGRVWYFFPSSDMALEVPIIHFSGTIDNVLIID